MKLRDQVMLKVHKIIHKQVRFLRWINRFQPLLMNVVARGKKNGGLSSLKQKARPVSGGTVSSMLGKGYMKSVPLANGSYPGTKPMKVDSKEMPMSLFWGEELDPSSQNEDRMHKDMEDFLFKMLGDGFRLERDMIREVLSKPTSFKFIRKHISLL
ncbi:hypothetical protein Gogos_012997, partial [Gossypium gossypioides]|nr:hypothetical protein [Gossypium gossypioides]